MDQQSSDKITRAKVGLILGHPFFACLALGVKYSQNDQIETASTDGKRIQYNPEFVNSLTADELKGLIAHEVMHIASLHHTRRQGREPRKWNDAADYAINQLLIDSGFKLPSGGLLNPQFKGMSAEEIYKLLPDPPPGKKQAAGQVEDAPGDPGKDGQPGKPATASQMKEAEAEAQQLTAQAAQVAKQQGKLPAHLQRLIDEALAPQVNWKDLLNSFLTEITRNDYTWKKPNRRYISQGLYLPSLENQEKGKFALIIDTSGSIDKVLLNQFAGEMQSILGEVAQAVTVLYVDTEVQEPVEVYEAEDEMNLNPQGGGGTDFRPGFEYLETQGIEAAAIVYFTDGYCSSFPEDKGTPVLWACYDNPGFTPPFGEVINARTLNNNP